MANWNQITRDAQERGSTFDIIRRESLDKLFKYTNRMEEVAKRLKLKNEFGGEKALANEASKILDNAQFAETLPKPKATPPTTLLESKDGYLYHGTNESILDNIKKEGLKPGRRGQLSVSTTEEYAKTFAREGMTPTGKTESVLLRVKADALNGKTTTKRVDGKERPVPDQQNELLTKETIAPENLEIYKDGKWQPLIDKTSTLLEEAKKYKSAEELSSVAGQPVSTTLANFIGKNAKTFNTKSSFKALDGMVRNQIDASLKMKPLFDDLVENRATGNKSWAQFVPLRELIDYPELFTAYPAAKNIRVSFMDMGKNDFGSFYLDDRGVPTINLNRSKKDATQTLKHEIQHFIQAKEGFSLGGNPDVLFRADVQNQVLKQQLRNVTRDKEIYQNATIGDMEYIKSAIEKTGRGEKLTTKEIEDFFGDEKEFNDLAMKTYKHLHGEWEAESNSIEELLKVKSPIFGKSKK